MSPYELFLFFLLIVKVTFVVTLLLNRVHPSALNTEIMHKSDDLFVLCMSGLMIYLFRPRNKNPVVIDYETKLFLFAFSVLQLIHLYKAR
jgi:uncharacterized protein YhhL (DUF1145 family)